MTSTAALTPGTLLAFPVDPAAEVVEPVVEPAPEPVVESVEPDVLGLAAAGTLAWVVERRRRQDAAAAEELRAVTHWADLHRVDATGSTGLLGAVEPEIRDAVERRLVREERLGVGLPGLLGVEGELRLAGQGAFRIEEFAVAELATALGMSEAAGRGYVGQALELRDRLPACWDRVMGVSEPLCKGVISNLNRVGGSRGVRSWTKYSTLWGWDDRAGSLRGRSFSIPSRQRR
jgi:hypothetical protein